MGTLTFFVVAIIVFYVARSIVHMVQRMYTYVPTRSKTRVLKEFPVKTSDGETLQFALQKAKQPANGKLSIFFHGNGGNMHHYYDFIRQDASHGYMVLTFDYRGYGNSTGVPSEGGLQEDAETALRYATHTLGIPSRDILLHGFSLGCGVAVNLASTHPEVYAGILLEAPFASTKSAAQHIVPGSSLVSFWLARDFDNESSIVDVNPLVPLAIAYTPFDEVVPASDSLAVFRASMAQSRYLESSAQRSHNAVHAQQCYVWLHQQHIGVCAITERKYID